MRTRQRQTVPYRILVWLVALLLVVLHVGCTGIIYSGVTCGDDVAEGQEQCDGLDFHGQDCAGLGFSGGNLACTASCTFDISACTGTGPVCGNNIAETGEVCDATDLAWQDCTSQGFTGGTLACNPSCDGFDTSACTGTGPVCGNNIAETGEVCDAADLAGQDCTSQGFASGTLACNPSCLAFDTSGCTLPSVCGNNIAETGEVCDAADLAGQDCASQGFASGTLACNSSCLAFDTSGCTTSEIEVVCNRWNADRANLSEGTWSGSVASCDPGDISANGRANALKLVNLYRWLADLPSVTTNAGRNQDTQACALMMHANGQLSHSPPASWTCYSSNGATAASRSNIASTAGVEAVDLYMADPGNPTTIGHRRWILSNSLGSIGLGSTNSYSCMWVINTGGSASAQWTAWPPPGPFPYDAVQVSWSSIDDTGWTFQSDSINLSGAQVTVTANGQNQPVTVNHLLSGYGSTYAISFVPNGWTTQMDTTYTVNVTGISTPATYDVQVVGCN